MRGRRGPEHGTRVGRPTELRGSPERRAFGSLAATRGARMPRRSMWDDDYFFSRVEGNLPPRRHTAQHTYTHRTL